MTCTMLRVVCITALVMPVGWTSSAQQGVPQSPSNAQQQSGAGSESTFAEVFAEDNTPVISPDTHPLTGALVSGPGSWGPRHSFLMTGFRAAQTLESNPEMSSPGTYRGFSSADLELRAIQYLGRGGEIRYVGAVRFDSAAKIFGARQVTNVHGAEVLKAISVGDWNFLIDDEAEYSQGSLFSGNGMEGLGSVVTQLSQWSGLSDVQLGSTVLQEGLTPDQSILTMRSGRISNTALAEVDRRIGNRGVATAAGYYGLLHFYSDGLIDSSQKGFVTGYNRAVSSRDQFGVEYGFARLGFSGTDTSLTTHYAALRYGRKLSGRLAMEAGAGPQYIASTADSANYTDLNWQGTASVDLHLRTLDLQVGALRMLTVGSGVLYGARTNSVQGNMTWRMNRNYSPSINFGVARNQGILSGDHYYSQFLGAALTRNLNRRVGAFLSYYLQRQTAAGCIGSSCAVTGVQQVIGAGIGWTFGPVGVH